MGFKRTPEGRVFFQGSDSANDESGPKLGQPRPSNPSPQMRSPLTGDKTQGQIVTLLKTLNERLKVTQADRDRMMGELEKHRSIIEDLEDKASRSEKHAFDLEHKLETQSKKAVATNNSDAIKELEETRRALAEMERNQSAHNKAIADKISKSSSGISALHKRIESTEAKQGVIDERVEAALNEQAKIIRKVDKAIEDRARFMRKIERIEETVIQTRDALNAKAMVVLTEQGVNSPNTVIDTPVKEGIAKYLPDDLEAQISEAAQNAKRVADIQTPSKNKQDDKNNYAKSKDARAWWQSSAFYGALTGGLAFILAMVVLGGLALNDWKLPSQTSEDVNQAPTETYYQTPQTPKASSNAQPIEDMNWSIEPDPQRPESAQQTEPQSTMNDLVSELANNNDVGAVDLNDAQQVEELIETNPQSVAAALNNIEPQTPAPEQEQQLTALEETPAAAAIPSTAAPQASAPQPTAPQQPIASQTAPPPAAKTPNTAQAKIIASQTSRDSSLPSVIKKVEDQAFQGIGEAQHDLAAIYTAGHGGVEQDYDRAAFWFEKASENGIANASYNLGVLHHQGLGFEANVKEAMTWYQDAASKGHPEAQYNLGIAYIEGIGVPYDPVTAANYFESAANNGVVEAAYNLGLIHENGLLGSAQPDNALLWYKTAADQGSPEAKQALNDLAGTLGIGTQDVNRIADNLRTNKATNNNTQTPPAAAQPVQNESNAASVSNIESSAVTNQGTVAQIQEYLMRAGLYPGPADGVSGALTSDAIRSYQSRNNMEVDGKATQILLSHMLANANQSAVFQNGN